VLATRNLLVVDRGGRARLQNVTGRWHYLFSTVGSSSKRCSMAVALQTDGLIFRSGSGLIFLSSAGHKLDLKPKDKNAPNEFATPSSRLGHAA
jgi:hypothetical protein